jgi:hypothetical protein
MRIPMNRDLTEMSNTMTMLLAGETEVGSAEVQPARDSRAKATDGRRDDGVMPVIPFSQIPFGAFLCLKKPHCRRQGQELIVKGVCPFHAEPLQNNNPENSPSFFHAARPYICHYGTTFLLICKYYQFFFAGFSYPHSFYFSSTCVYRSSVVSTQRMFSGFIFMTTYSGPAGICLQLVVFLSNFIAFSSF